MYLGEEVGMYMRYGAAVLLITAFILLIACDNSTPRPQSQSTLNPPSQIQPASEKSLPQTSQPSITLPAQSAANQLSLQIISVTSPVLAGSRATIVIQTLPNAECGITVNYKSGPSKANGLNTKIADSTGRVSWTWTVGSKTTPGTWQIVVESSCNGKTATQSTYFTVH